MVRLPSYLADLARDAELVGRDAQVWILAIPQLDFVEFRDLDLESLAVQFDPGISRASVCRSLQRLVERGYVEREDARGTAGRGRYRLPLRRIYPRPAMPTR